MPHQHSGKKEKSAWQAWQAYEEGTETFQYSADHPFEHLNAEFRNIKRLIVILYDNSSPVSSVNDTRKEQLIVTRIKVWIGYHLLMIRMHYFSTLNEQFTKLEFGQPALRCSK